jgi:hypothetical protein
VLWPGTVKVNLFAPLGHAAHVNNLWSRWEAVFPDSNASCNEINSLVAEFQAK